MCLREARDDSRFRRGVRRAVCDVRCAAVQLSWRWVFQIDSLAGTHLAVKQGSGGTVGEIKPVQLVNACNTPMHSIVTSQQFPG